MNQVVDRVLEIQTFVITDCTKQTIGVVPCGLKYVPGYVIGPGVAYDAKDGEVSVFTRQHGSRQMIPDLLVFLKELPQKFVDKGPAGFVEMKKNKAGRNNHRQLPKRDRCRLGLGWRGR